MDIFNKEECI